MKIQYIARSNSARSQLLAGKEDFIALLSDNWDDFNYKTTFRTVCKIGGSTIELGDIKLLLEDEQVSSIFLNNRLKDNWDGIFPLLGINYISVPSDINFYQQIIDAAGSEAAASAARALRDASYLCWVEEDQAAVSLANSQPFKTSLQREPGAVKAFADGWRIHKNIQVQIESTTYNFDSVLGNSLTLNFHWGDEGLLPNDIDVVIGPNGVGKSQLLHRLVETWLTESQTPHLRNDFESAPNLSQVIVVSYSPFERFPLKADRTRWKDTGAYRYFGLRSEINGPRGSEIKLSRTKPKADAALSLIASLADDQRYAGMKSRPPKIATAQNVLRTAFQFDFAALRIKNNINPSQLVRSRAWADELLIQTSEKGERQRFVIMAPYNIDQLIADELADSIHLEEGVTFFRNNEKVHLSSGQRLFSYMVLSVMGAIRTNSLILIDEPELFLHPTLEISFLRMLKAILGYYRSKAILATHSLVTVRETPRDRVHVFERTNDGTIRITHPPFETFGGDVQRISSYVFGDKSVEKPFSDWLSSKAKEVGAKELMRQLGTEINEETVILLSAMAKVTQ